MNQMRIRDPWEFILFAFMVRWQQKAPADRHWGELDGKPTCNSQEARLAYVLQKAAVGRIDSIYSGLSRYTRRMDGNSYVSRNPAWMKSPMHLLQDWFLEGCQKIEQKNNVLENLTKLGFSPEFEACAKDFVAGQNIKGYLPNFEELGLMFEGYPGINFNGGSVEMKVPELLMSLIPAQPFFGALIQQNRIQLQPS